jgi:hypothetical protein
MGDEKRYNVCAVKQYESRGEQRSKWFQVGKAFDTRKGIKVRLDALPLNFDGELMLFEETLDASRPSPKEYKSDFSVGDAGGGDVPF